MNIYQFLGYIIYLASRIKIYYSILMREIQLGYRVATQAAPAPAPTLRAGAVLSEAVANVARYWKIPNERLGQILGISDSSVSRLRSGKYSLEARSKAFELGQYLVRLFRSLDAMTGADDRGSMAWLAAPHPELGGAPLELITSITGLVRVCDYVDAQRARV
jgi:uncharacterized protein (DUF2384 family)